MLIIKLEFKWFSYLVKIIILISGFLLLSKLNETQIIINYNL